MSVGSLTIQSEELDVGTKRPGRWHSWLEIAIGNGGFLAGQKALLWAIFWGITREAVGHDPSVEEVAEFCRRSERTAFRDLAAFRKSFPGMDTPAWIVDEPNTMIRIADLARKMKDLEDSSNSRFRIPEKDVLAIGLIPGLQW